MGEGNRAKLLLNEILAHHVCVMDDRHVIGLVTAFQGDS